MAAFPQGRNTVLVVNHENDEESAPPVPTLDGLTYDPGARGGTTTIVVDENGDRITEYVSLAGTVDNCAGGRTPWHTWLSCEEEDARAGDGDLQRDHGYVFEVDAFDRDANLEPIPLKFLGRFEHEAVAVDPSDTTMYLTEDADEPNGLLFRWTPPAGFRAGKGALRMLATSHGGDTAGTLQAMACYKGSRHVADLSEATRPGTRYRVRWVDVPDRDARAEPIRTQFGPGEVTRSRKFEGAYWGNGGAYIVSSYGRYDDGSVNEHDGQVWFYDPKSETIALKTIFGVNPDPDAGTHYDGPDNIAVAPDGGIILAEDGEGIQHLIGVTKDGKPYPLARNEVDDEEFAGPTFSDDGRTLYVNVMGPAGRVFAITGPWEKQRGRG